ncbi:MAG: ATP-dependent DNA helicase RecG [Rhodospirillaceae bacterium]|nr:ATP-dependent DNA helicase RecG [Rhodospirillaceae bacterium]
MALRPTILNPLFTVADTLSGIGPRFAKLLERLSGSRLIDLIWHLPNGVIDRRFAPKVVDAPTGRICTLTVEVLAHIPPPNRSSRLPYKITCGDDTGRVTLTFFHAQKDYLNQVLPVGKIRVISGKIEIYDGQMQMAHPDHIVTEEQKGTIQRVEPIYPLTAGLSPKTLAKGICGALDKLPELPEWLDDAQIKRDGWPRWKDALIAAHQPGSLLDLDLSTSVRNRLSYDELLSNQLALAIVRMKAKRLSGRSIKGTGNLRSKVLAALPFKLTGAQKRTLGEIDQDLTDNTRMLRLLQGDVGSGKTVVALMSMLSAVESGGQAALMVPTELLAQQHLATLQPLCEACGVSIAFLSSRVKGKSRDAVLEQVGNGGTSILVGTHALFQKDVAFRDLKVAVVDEQHRFGVHQRLELANKGRGVDMLVMTATPIPRTLTLTAYGDMDVSRLDEKPPGRKPIDTRLVNLERLVETISAVQRAIKSGAKVYWVCPLVEESETSDLAAAEERHKHLSHILGENVVALVHGRMKGPEKDAAMSAFSNNHRANGPKVLVATTVIEVGVDVPEATVMIVEHAERFGLAQLHQLRGRIGRGDKPSTCLLLYQAPLTETATARLNILRDTEDGFLIAEEDLKLRGGGEVLGTRQSGLPEFRLADLSIHANLLIMARDDTKLILDRDPDLKSDRGEALRTLLYLFEQDAAIQTLRSG